jgi:hypothetical protein
MATNWIPQVKAKFNIIDVDSLRRRLSKGDSQPKDPILTAYKLIKPREGRISDIFEILGNKCGFSKE